MAELHQISAHVSCGRCSIQLNPALRKSTSSLCHEHTLDWEIGVSLLQARESGTISLLYCDNLTLSLDTLNVF